MEFSSKKLSQAYATISALKYKQTVMFDKEEKRLSISCHQRSSGGESERLRRVVRRLVKELNAQYSSDLKDEYRSFFLKRMVNLEENIFDRSLISDKILNALLPKLFKGYQKYRDQYLEIGCQTLTRDERFYRAARKAACLALKLGVAPFPISEGVNGSYFLKDLSGHPIGVFKPWDEEVLSKHSSSRIRTFKSLTESFKVCATITSLQSGNGYKSEVMASLLSREFDLDTVPTTRKETFRSVHFAPKKVKTGSFQLYVPNSYTAGKMFGISSKRSYLVGGKKWIKIRKRSQKLICQKLTQEQFERLAETDFAICAIDRSLNNLLFSEQGVFCIDNGISFPFHHPTTVMSRLNLYPWEHYPHAKRPFGPEAKKRILRNLEQLDALLASFDEKGLITHESQIETTRERYRTLAFFAEHDIPIRKLAKMKTEKDFKQSENFVRRHAASSGDVGKSIALCDEFL